MPYTFKSQEPGYCLVGAGENGDTKNYAIVSHDQNWGYCTRDCRCKYLESKS